MYKLLTKETLPLDRLRGAQEDNIGTALKIMSCDSASLKLGSVSGS
jgi:hypothetical protein